MALDEQIVAYEGANPARVQTVGVLS